MATHLPQTLEEEDLNENPLDSIYEMLVIQESQPPHDPLEVIPSGKITKDDPEFVTLLETGVSAEDISIGNLTREQLLNAGFVFNNYPFPSVEKPLLNVTINGVNYGQRKFLTQEELDMIKEFQRANPEMYGDERIESDEFRKDVLSMLISSNYALPMHIEHKVNFLRACAANLDYPLENLYGSSSREKNPRLVQINAVYKQLWAEYKKINFTNPVNIYGDEQEFIANHLADIMNWTESDPSNWYRLSARGCQARHVDSRVTKLNGIPSPFLNSGFHFGRIFKNPDFTVIGKDGKPFRVNLMVLHLLSEGISEMGDGTQQDGDQDYTIGNYLRNLYSDDPEVRRQYLAEEAQKFAFSRSFKEEDLMEAIQGRLKEVSTAWANSEHGSPNARTLLQKIQKLESGKKGFDLSSIKSLLQRR